MSRFCCCSFARDLQAAAAKHAQALAQSDVGPICDRLRDATPCTGATFARFPSYRSTTFKKHLNILKSLFLHDVKCFSNVLAPCETQILSFLDLKKVSFRTPNRYLFALKSVPKSIKIVCFTVSLEVLEFSIRERENSILGKIMTSRKGPKVTETV